MFKNIAINICCFKLFLFVQFDKSKVNTTFPRLAVKRMHSNNCPILSKNSSTCGLFKTYTCKKIQFTKTLSSESHT